MVERSSRRIELEIWRRQKALKILINQSFSALEHKTMNEQSSQRINKRIYSPLIWASLATHLRSLKRLKATLSQLTMSDVVINQFSWKPFSAFIFKVFARHDWLKQIAISGDNATEHLEKLISAYRCNLKINILSKWYYYFPRNMAWALLQMLPLLT